MSELYDPVHLPCGGTAYYDAGSGCSHRCKDCMATVGSISMPPRCKDEMDKWDNWEKLGGQGWDYYCGKPQEKSKPKVLLFTG